MKIAIIGYGKMGRMIERIAQQQGHVISMIFDPNLNNPLSAERLTDIDVAIEFTSPAQATDNYITCINAHVPVVSGTTGWLQDWDDITTRVKKQNTAFFYASNFSLGVNLLFQLNADLARKMATLSEYQANIVEIHHTHKLDAPSGTALTLAEKILEYNNNLNSWVLNTNGSDENLPIFSIREGEIPGTHSVNYISKIDKISIKHEAFGREGFALGAVKAAEYIYDKSGIFSMEDLLAE